VQNLNFFPVCRYLFIQLNKLFLQVCKICRAAIVKPFSASSKISGNADATLLA